MGGGLKTISLGALDPKSNVLEYLKREGFPFEMQVTKLFQEKGFDVNSSVYFEDINTGKSREIDVIASKSVFLQSSTILFRLKFLIECKYSKENPWVLFKSQNDNSTFPKYSPQLINASEFGRSALIEIQNNPNILENDLFNLLKNMFYGIRCVTKKTQNENNDQRKDLPYEALMKVSNAVVASQKYINEIINKGFVSRIELYFPLVIVYGLLFECFLDKNSEIVVNKIDEGIIKLNQPELTQEKFHIRIISSDALENIVTNLSDSCDQLITDLENNISDTIKIINNKNRT